MQELVAKGRVECVRTLQRADRLEANNVSESAGGDPARLAGRDRKSLREVWGGETDVQYLRVYIRALRQKLEADPERPQQILTETGVGYRLRAPDWDMSPLIAGEKPA